MILRAAMIFTTAIETVSLPRDPAIFILKTVSPYKDYTEPILISDANRRRNLRVSEATLFDFRVAELNVLMTSEGLG